MPAYGLVCCQTGETCDIDSCRDKAAHGECQYPLPIFGYLESQGGARKDAGLSVTTLLGCARRAELQREYKYPARPANMGAVFQGDMWHLAMEHWATYPGAIKERRYAIDIDGVEVTGKIDLAIPSTHVLFDHKTTSRPLYCDEGDTWCEQQKIKGPPEGYELQLGFYRLLIEDGYELKTGLPSGVTIDTALIDYVNPTNGSRAFVVDMVSKDEARAMMSELVEPIRIAREKGELPEILKPKLITRRVSKRVDVDRDYRCRKCELRHICDRLAMLDTGLNPNRSEYWTERNT